MSNRYRQTLPPCPLCRATMQERAAAEAVVDICPDCNAVWIDWFDGDVSTVARDVHVSKAIPVNDSDSRPCPRCHVELATERLHGRGPHVFRCSDCSGVLVPSAMLDEVVELGSEGERPDSAGPMARVIAMLRRVFGSSD